MRRSDFLALTVLTDPVFTAMSHRDVLPFEPKRAKGKGWAEYSGDDVLAMEIALSASRYGLTQEHAAELAQVVFPDVLAQLRKAEPATEILLAFAGKVDREREQGRGGYGVAFVVSKQPRQEMQSIHVELGLSADDGPTFLDVVLINISARVAVLRERAKRRSNAEALLVELSSLDPAGPS